MNIIVSIVLMVASMLITSMMTKRQKVKPASLEEFDFPQADEGVPQAVVFGEFWSPGWQVLWYGNLRTKKIKSGGKK